MSTGNHMKGGDNMNESFADYCDQRLQCEDEEAIAKEEYNAYMRQYKHDHPEKIREYRVKQWARKRLRRDYEREIMNENGPDGIIP